MITSDCWATARLRLTKTRATKIWARDRLENIDNELQTNNRHRKHISICWGDIIHKWKGRKVSVWHNGTEDKRAETNLTFFKLDLDINLPINPRFAWLDKVQWNEQWARHNKISIKKILCNLDLNLPKCFPCLASWVWNKRPNWSKFVHICQIDPKSPDGTERSV